MEATGDVPMNEIVEVQVTRYRCSVCSAEYSTEAEALLQCGDLATEPALHHEGAVVRRLGAPPLFGLIIAVVGPVRGNRTHTDGRRLRFTTDHVYRYRVQFPGSAPPVELYANEISVT